MIIRVRLEEPRPVELKLKTAKLYGLWSAYDSVTYSVIQSCLKIFLKIITFFELDLF